MPASTVNHVNTVLCSALSNEFNENRLDVQLTGSTKKALLSKIEFEHAGTYQSTILDNLMSKYIVLKSTEGAQTR